MKRQSQEILAAETGHPVEQIAEDSDRDRWFTADEARDYGIVDRVVSSFAEIAPHTTAPRIGL